MTEPLVFMMGEYKAEFPVDRQFARNHMWAQALGPRRWRFGFTSYAVRLLQDVYFLEWQHDAPFAWNQGQEVGSIESKKAESSLYAPLAGQVLTFNQQLLQDPSTINVDKYGRGWLFEMESDDAALLMSPEQYVEHLTGVWEKTQRTIKGQMNE